MYKRQIKKGNIKSIMLPFFTLCFSTIIGCSPIPSTSPFNISQVQFSEVVQYLNLASDEKPTVIDVGNGKSGSIVGLKLNFKTEGFKTKSNTSGFDGAFSGSIDSFKIALVTSAGDGSSALTTKPSGTSADIFSITKAQLTANGHSASTSSANILLTNVPAYSGGYYIAVAVFDSDSRNQTKLINTGGIISGEKYAVSTGGGLNNNGKVVVGTDLKVDSSLTLTVPLTIVDSFGATIESPVTITNGTAKIKSDIQLIRFYIVESNAGTLTNSDIKTGPFDITSSSSGTLGTLFSNLTGSGGTGTIKFNNVISGTYYVAAAAYSSTSTINSTTNITNLTANSHTHISLTSPTLDLGEFALSNSGGDGGNTGTISINSTYGISSTSSVVLPLKLKD